MRSVFDFAALIKARLKNVDEFTLNKLVYYVQAWSLVWRGEPAFPERIEAWKNGPVTNALWSDYKHHNSTKLQNASPLGVDDLELVEQVLFHYGQMSAAQLIELTHSEDPWRQARCNLPANASSSEPISLESMSEYYGQQWREAVEDNRAFASQPAFVGSIEDFETFLG
jgi:uncharacterized phage-associated protein